MNKKLYVGNLPFSAEDAQLQALFAADGRQVASVRILMDRETGRSRGFAFVEMATSEGAQQALQQLDGQELDCRMLRINEAREREARGPRQYGGPSAAGPGASAGPAGGGYGGARPATGFGGPPRCFGGPPSGGYRPSGGPGGATTGEQRRKAKEREKEREGGDDRGKKARRGRNSGDDGW